MVSTRRGGGDIRAVGVIGLMYQKGEAGLPVNVAEANARYRRAADAGDSISQHYLASNLENGNGVAKDRAEAVRYYRLAATQGLKESLAALVRMGESATGTVAAAAPTPPPAAPAPAPAAPAFSHFTSFRAAYEGVKATRYVDFSFDYPTSAGWSLQQGAELRAFDAFAQLSHKENTSDPTAIEGFIVGYFNSNNERSAAEGLPVLGPQLMAQINAKSAKSYPNYRKVSEGMVKFGPYNAYELRGAARLTTGPYANSDIWIRMVVVAPNDGGKNGVSLLFLSSSRAGIQSVADVGAKGDLGIIANSFRVGR